MQQNVKLLIKKCTAIHEKLIPGQDVFFQCVRTDVIQSTIKCIMVVHSSNA